MMSKRKTNVIIVYDLGADKILMCLRSKAPYQGLYNLPGGKIEENEDGLTAAYRELKEETGISQEDIILTSLMDFDYHLLDLQLQVYVGKLNKEITLIEEANRLSWFSTNENFFDQSRFAGEGNIGHMLKQVELYKGQLLK